MGEEEKAQPKSIQINLESSCPAGSEPAGPCGQHLGPAPEQVRVQPPAQDSFQPGSGPRAGVGNVEGAAEVRNVGPARDPGHTAKARSSFGARHPAGKYLWVVLPAVPLVVFLYVLYQYVSFLDELGGP